jgi:hypothetical protein
MLHLLRFTRSRITYHDLRVDEARAGVEEDYSLACAEPAFGAQAADGGEESRAFGADPEAGAGQLAQGGSDLVIGDGEGGAVGVAKSA